MGFPSKQQLKQVLKKLENTEGTLSLPQNPTPLEKLRWDICQQFIIFKKHKGFNQKELAKLIDIDDSKISKILHHRIEEFSTDRLISLVEKINPSVKFKVS